MVDPDLDKLAEEMWLRIAALQDQQVDPNVQRALDWQEQDAQRREQRRLEREQKTRERRARDRMSFGEENWGASEDHLAAGTVPDLLARYDLPVLASEQALAEWLGIDLSRLRWLTYDKPAETVWHYVRFSIPKRSGGERTILAPKRELKAIQRQILQGILEKLPTSEPAHGFIRGRSIVSNAQPHVRHQFVLNVDLSDFFPSITFPRVRGLFISFGYSFAVASTLALLCTGREREAFDRDDGRYYISVSERYLVQGAPTSPAIANLIARALDHRLSGLAAKHGFAYTRYADDLTFSGDTLDHALRILDASGYIIGDEGFRMHPGKVRLYRRSGRQLVTGLVVNEKANAPRELRRRVRAILHQAKHTGLEAQNTEGRDHFRAYLNGLIAYIHASNPQAARRLWSELASVPD